MALASDNKAPSSGLLDRCFSGTPKIQLDLDRISRLASLGLPRRVPCGDRGRLAEDSDRKNESPSSKISDGVNNSYRESSVDSSEARKRKAERDAPSTRDRCQVRQTDARSYPNALSNFDLGEEARNRKAIDSAKETFGVQDKENINPCCGYSREPKMPVSDRSAEKRRFQVSSKLQNVPPSRKVGSLLVKQTLKSRVRAPLYDAPQRPTTPQSDSLLKEMPQQQDSPHDCIPSARADKPMDCNHAEQTNNDMSAPMDSMSISQPLQFIPLSADIPKLKSERDAKWYDARCKSSISADNYLEMRESRSCSVTVESDQDGVVMKSLKELSSSMNGLAIVDTHIDDLQMSPVAEKDELKRGLNKHLHGSFITEAKHSVPDNQASISAGCSSLPVVVPSSSTACSITIRTASAPLTHSYTDENVQPLSPKNGQPLEIFSPNPADREVKPSQVNYEFQPCQSSMQRDERERPGKVAESVSRHPQGHERSPQDDVPICDVGAGKVIQNQQLPEKNSGHPPKRQVEHENFVVINGKKYQKLKKIGRGGSSEVFKAIDRESNIYALKRIKLKGRDYATASGFYQEIELLTRLQGKKYIIRLIDHEVTDKNLFSGEVDGSSIIKHDAHIYMVLEFGEVDLATMLQEKWKERTESNNAIDETWLRFYWKQILEAVNTVHEERIMHADLKPANFLLVKGVLKLIDFGIAKSIQGDTTNIEREAQVGTLNYMSPEAFLMNERDEHGNVIKCGRSSDIWALGCILYQMVYGKTPFAHITSLHAKIQEVANPRHKINYLPVSNPHLLDIMKKCLAYNRDERLRIPELLNHPFLQPQLAQAVLDRRVTEEIMREVEAEERRGRDATSLRRVLARLGGC